MSARWASRRFWRIIGFAVVAALLLSPHTFRTANANPTTKPYDGDAAQGFATAYVERHGLPGAAYAVVKDGELVASGGAGHVGATTPLPVGSVSKSITAFAVLQLVDRGQVSLDDPVTEHLPEFSVGGADPESITVRMLLSHTSGLPNPLLFDGAGSLEATVANIAGIEVAATPGESYAYSNLNYRTLARMVEVLGGQEFGDHLTEHVFAPLGMDDTFAVVTSTDLDDGHVTAYGAALPLPELGAVIGGSGGVVSTAEDMAAWLGMYQRGGVAPDETRLLSAELIEQSLVRQPNAGTYALGWQHTSTADPARVGHDGSLTRYSAREDLVPSSGYATVVLLDSYTPTYQHPFSISTGLIDISEGERPDPGLPVATLIDLALGAVAVGVVLLGVLGVRRSTRWAQRRASHPLWRRVLRMMPQAILPVVAFVLFIGLTAGPQNPATPVDAFGLWPAAMILILAGALVGIALIVTRTVAFARGPGPTT